MKEQTRSGLSEGQKEHIFHSRKNAFKKHHEQKILATLEFAFFNKKLTPMGL